MPPINFLPSVPTDVQLWAESQLRASGGYPSAQKLRGQIIRLVTSDVMRIAWNEIDSIAEVHKDFSALELARQAISSTSRWSFIGKTRPSTVKAIENRIATTAAKLADLLEEYRSIQEFCNDNGMETAKLMRVAGKSGTDPLRKEIYEAEVGAMLDESGLERYLPPMHDILRTLSAYATQSTTQAKIDLQPTKANDKNAKRTFCIRTLSAYLRQTTGHPHHGLVANIISAIFDDQDIDENLVTKLTLDLS